MMRSADEFMLQQGLLKVEICHLVELGMDMRF